ncbi:MAG: hypothetical protein ACR2ME_02000 [Acidimicrobiia bacterium]
MLEAAAALVAATVTEEVVVLEAARARKQARLLADQGDYDAARKLLLEKVEELRSISPNSPLAEIANDDIVQLEHFERRMDLQTYDRTDSKLLWEQSRRRHRSQDYPKRPDRP